MLAAGTVMVSGCIENLEPDGISDLRGAKLELLKAQTALQAAQAAKIEAETAILMAEAKIKEAVAKQEEAKIKYEEALALQAQYEAEYQKLMNEAYAQETADAHNERVEALKLLIAQNEAEIAALNREAEAAAAALAVTLLQTQNQLLNTQALYEAAVKDLQLAKVEFTDRQLQYLFKYEAEVQKWKEEVDNLTAQLKGQGRELERRIAMLDKAKADTAAIREYQFKVMNKEAKLETAKEAEAKAKEMLELDPVLTDWDALREELVEEQNALAVEKVAITLEMEQRAKVWRDSLDLVKDLAQGYADVTGFAWDCTIEKDGVTGTGLFKIVPKDPTKEIALPEIYVEVPEGHDWGFTMPTSYYYNKQDAPLKAFDAEIRLSNAYATYSHPYKQRLNASLLKLAESQPETDFYKKVIEQYNDMVAAYTSEDYLTYAYKYVFSEDLGFEAGHVETVLASYNEALNAFKAAFEKYSAEHVTPEVEKLQELIDAKATALAAANDKYVKTLDEAKKVNNLAEAKYHAAVHANRVALQIRDKKIEDALYVVGFDVVNKEYIPGRDCAWKYAVDNAINEVKLLPQPVAPAMPNDPSDPDYELLLGQYEKDMEQYEKDLYKYNNYQSALASILKAEVEYDDPASLTDPMSVWEAAVKEWGAAQQVLADAQANAKKVFDQESRQAQLNYENALDLYKNSLPKVDGTYSADLLNALIASLEELQNIVPEVQKVVDVVTSVGNVKEVKVTYVSPAILSSVSYVPEYLVNEDQELIEFKMENLVALLDKDAKLAALKEFYDKFVFFVADPQFPAKNLGERLCEDYPLSFPTYDEYRTFVEATRNKEGKPTIADPADTPVASLYYDSKFKAETEVEGLANIEIVYAWVAALEAAKAEVVAFMAEKEKELAAVRADVENVAPRLIAELEENLAGVQVWEDRNTVLTNQLNVLVQAIKTFIPNKNYEDLEGFVEFLENEYETRCKQTYNAETELIRAKQNLDSMFDEKADAVMFAQNDFNDIQEELTKAMDKLAVATAELEAALARLEVCEEDEVPTPETPAE